MEKKDLGSFSKLGRCGDRGRQKDQNGAGKHKKASWKLKHRKFLTKIGRIRLPLLKDEKDSEAYAGKAGGVIPTKLFARIGHGEDGENRECNDFLDGLELRRAEFERADAVRT